MIICLQINLNRCRAAQALLHQIALNVKSVQIDDLGCSEDGFRWVTISGTRVYSCYWSPNSSFQDYLDFLTRLERSIRLTPGNILLTGDFNAKHTDWGSQFNDRRGEALSDLVHATGLITCNIGNSPTCRSATIIDVTFASQHIKNNIMGWCVL